VVSDAELVELKDSLQQSLNFIPEDSMIALITFGKMVQVHQLNNDGCPQCYVFRGDKEIDSKNLLDQLGIKAVNDPLLTASDAALKKFLVTVGECEFALNTILDDL